jgi:tetrathionate reductase subunit A
MSAIDKKVTRRQFILGSVAATSGVVAVGGSWPWLPKMFYRPGTYNYPMLTEGQGAEEVRYSVCRQCRSDCGIEARVVNGVLVKLDGNPYHPNTTEPHLDYATPVAKARMVPVAHSLCARGQAGRQTVYDRYRMYYPLKRAGARGSNKWKTISWEQLTDEVTNGGNLFKDVPGEESRYVEGFRDLWKNGHGPNIPVDPRHPDMGPITNQFVAFWGRAEPGQSDFIERFAKAFGSVNAIPHVSICELSHHVATRTSLNGKINMMKPDFKNSEYVIFFGVNLYQANFPMQTVSRKVAAAASGEGPNPPLKYVIVDSRTPQGVERAIRHVKVQPGHDGALAMGMIRHIIETHRYNADYLSYPGSDAAARGGELNFTNATWLVVADPHHALHRQFLTAEAAGLVPRGAGPVVIDAATGRPGTADHAVSARLWPGRDLSTEPIRVNGIACQTSFQILYEEARSHTIEEYAELAGIRKDAIVELAQEFTAHGRRAAADFYRGPVKHTNGAYSGRAIMTLNFLIGCIDWAGGYITGGKPADYLGTYKGAPYNLTKWPSHSPARTVPPGVTISREGSFYEETSLYKEAVTAGKNPFPTPRPWLPFGFGIWQELFGGAWSQYPYPVKILFMHEANPAWSAPPGMSGYPDENLSFFRLIKDLKKVPLFIASDILVAETSSYADYIVPDTNYPEIWGMLPGFPTIPTSVIGVRHPVIEPLTAKTPTGAPMCMENFLIDVAKKLGMPGFGRHAFLEGGDLNEREDLYLKMIANIAYDSSLLRRAGGRLVATGPVPDASTPDDWREANRFKVRHGAALREAQWAKVAYVLSRGGRFEDYDVGYLPGRPEVMTYRYGAGKLPCQIYNPIVARTHNTISGEWLSGVAKFEHLRLLDGRRLDALDSKEKYPFVLITYKQPIHSKSRTWADQWLVELMPESFAEMNPFDARNLGVKDGDWVIIRSATYPKGYKTQVQIMPGVRPGVVSFPAAFGHWHYNSGHWTVNGETHRGDDAKNTRTRMNHLMRLDPSITAEGGWGTCLQDPYGGSACYYDTRVQIEKTMAPKEGMYIREARV